MIGLRENQLEPELQSLPLEFRGACRSEGHRFNSADSVSRTLGQSTLFCNAALGAGM
jgi:hypothetical protein